MTYTPPPAAPDIPTLAQRLLHDYAQKVLTIVATALTGYGVLPADQGGNFVAAGVGIVLAVASLAWTFIAAKIRDSREKALKSASVPK